MLSAYMPGILIWNEYGAIHPDDASMVIIRELWKRLQ
jgi:hypothetical protein